MDWPSLGLGFDIDFCGSKPVEWVPNFCKVHAC